jgi:hypothetical protein
VRGLEPRAADLILTQAKKAEVARRDVRRIRPMRQPCDLKFVQFFSGLPRIVNFTAIDINHHAFNPTFPGQSCHGPFSLFKNNITKVLTIHFAKLSKGNKPWLLNMMAMR